MSSIYTKLPNGAELQLSMDCRELEIYVGGYFLCSVDTDNISPKALDQLQGDD